MPCHSVRLLARKLLEFIDRIFSHSATSMKAAVPSFVLLKRDDPAETMIASKDFNKLEEFVEQHSLLTYVSGGSFLFQSSLSFTLTPQKGDSSNFHGTGLCHIDCTNTTHRFKNDLKIYL